MSYVIAAPELMTAAAADVRGIGSTLNVANAVAAAQAYQALSAHAAAFHEQFVQALTAGAGSYVSAEAANVAAFGNQS